MPLDSLDHRSAIPYFHPLPTSSRKASKACAHARASMGDTNVMASSKPKCLALHRSHGIVPEKASD